MRAQEKPRRHKQRDSGSRKGCRTDWTAAVHCDRCRGLLYRVWLRDWGGGPGQDSGEALQCIACGDIIDPVIVKNRRCSRRLTKVGRLTREEWPRVAIAL